MNMNGTMSMSKIMMVTVLWMAGMSTALAQGDGYSARSIGMARTFAASSRGLDAIGLNPANLALTDHGTSVTFTLVPPVGLSLSSNFFNLDLYNNYFTGVDSLDANGSPTGKKVGRKWTEADKRAILGRMDNGMSYTDLNVNAMLFGAVVHAGSFGIGFSVNDHVGVALDLPDSYLQFAFYGLDSAGSRYNFGQTAMRSLWYREYNLSTGVMLPIETKAFHDVAVGVGLKMVQGFNYISTVRNNSSLSSTPMSDSMSVTGVFDLEAIRAGLPMDSTTAKSLMTPGGKGFGLDLGVSAQVFRGIRVAASVLNIGSINWSGPNTKRLTGNATYSWSASKYDQAELDRVKDSVNKIFTPVTTPEASLSTPLPTSLHAGTSIDMQQFLENFPVPLNLAADVHFGLNDQPGNYASTLVGLGAELELLNGWLPIRMGVLMGGREKILWSGGVGIHFWRAVDLDLATESMSTVLMPNSFKTGSFCMAMKVRI
jgi:hypothetical protein